MVISNFKAYVYWYRLCSKFLTMCVSRPLSNPSILYSWWYGDVAMAIWWVWPYWFSALCLFYIIFVLSANNLNTYLSADFLLLLVMWQCCLGEAVTWRCSVVDRAVVVLVAGRRVGPRSPAMDTSGRRQRTQTKASAEDQALDQIAKEVGFLFIFRVITHLYSIVVSVYWKYAFYTIFYCNIFSEWKT